MTIRSSKRMATLNHAPLIGLEVVESRLRYGCCEVLNWYALSEGPLREAVWARHPQIASEVIRIHAFDRGTPDPVAEWPRFAGYIQAVLNSGAVPMITFTRFKAPVSNPHNRRWFANRCGDVVWNCIQRWGEDAVRDWYWSVWTKPNSPWDSPGMTFESYRAIYESVAEKIVRSFGRSLGDRKPLIGGPSVDGFQPFWFDWIWRFVDEIDNALIGFVSWHRYSEWRAQGKWRSATDAHAFGSLVMSRTSEYCTMARAVHRVLQGRNILNVCGELNAHAHYSPNVSGGFNQGSFGAAYYVSALLQLIKGGADLELRWSGSDARGGPFGVMDADGRPNCVFFAKMLFVHLVRRGAKICFARNPQTAQRKLETARVEDPEGNEAVIIVHKGSERTWISLEDLGLQVPRTGHLLSVDTSGQGRVTRGAIEEGIGFDGYGVAMATSCIPAALGINVGEAAGQLA